MLQSGATPVYSPSVTAVRKVRAIKGKPEDDGVLGEMRVEVGIRGVRVPVARSLSGSTNGKASSQNSIEAIRGWSPEETCN
jgi:hypothetical protein